MKTCAECGQGHDRKKSQLCSRKCSNRRYRGKNLEKVRAAVSAANRRRYATDPAFRAAHVEQKKSWARKKRAVIGTGWTNGYRSRMEEQLAPTLISAGATYESLRFTFPAKPRGYTPDFILPNGIAIEVKGWFTGKDRAKMLAVKQHHPNLDLRLILASPRQFTTQKRKMTQAQWCDKHGFKWAEMSVPATWLIEPLQPLAGLALMNGTPVKKNAGRRV